MKRSRFLRPLAALVLCLCLLAGGAAASEDAPFLPRTDGAGSVQARLEQVYAEYPAGKATSGSFEAGGTTCFGFAKMVVYRVFGKKGSSFRSWDYAGGSRVGMTLIGKLETCTTDNVRELMAKARPGDVLQFDRGAGVQHTMIVWSVSDTGVTIYENNWTPNTVTRAFETFSQLAARQIRWNGTKRGALSLLRADNYDEIEGIPTPTAAPTPTPAPQPMPTTEPTPTPTPVPTAPPAPLPSAYDAALILNAVVSKTSTRTPVFAAIILRELSE